MHWGPKSTEYHNPHQSPLVSLVPISPISSMIKKEEVYKIGRIGKAHGVHGEVTLQFDDDVFDRVEAEYLVLEVDGLLVPFFMEEYRFRSDATAYFPLSLASEDEAPISLAFLVGFDIVEANTPTPIGTIAAIDDQTANVLFELTDGTLIPANDDLVRKIDKDKRQIIMELPEGLLALR